MKFKISKEEKNLQTIYLFCLWLFLTALFAYVSFNHINLKGASNETEILTGIHEQKLILDEQKGIEKHLDTLNKMLLQYNPAISQVYLESSINHELEEIKRAAEKNEHPANNILFNQLKELYGMYYFDKKATWNTVSNSNFLKKNLEECEVGFQQAQNTLTIQEALKNNQPSSEK